MKVIVCAHAERVSKGKGAQERTHTFFFFDTELKGLVIHRRTIHATFAECVNVHASFLCQQHEIEGGYNADMQ
jgi:hypothetical protein